VDPDRWAETRRRLLGFVIPRVASREDAEDVVQEVLARLARDITTLRDGDRLDAWAYRVARNAVTDEHRRRGRQHAALARVAHEDPGEPADLTAQPVLDADLLELTSCLQPLITSLGEPHRQALQLTGIDGLTQVQAAAIEQVTVSGMKSRVQRGRDRLREALLACCAPDPDGPHLRGRPTTRPGDPAGCAPAGRCGCATTPT